MLTLLSLTQARSLAFYNSLIPLRFAIANPDTAYISEAYCKIKRYNAWRPFTEKKVLLYQQNHLLK